MPLSTRRSFTRRMPRLVGQHRLDGSPFVIAEFVAHGQKFRFYELESRLGQRHQAAIAGSKAANAVSLLPLSVALRTWPDLPLGRPGRE